MEPTITGTLSDSTATDHPAIRRESGAIYIDSSLDEMLGPLKGDGRLADQDQGGLCKDCDGTVRARPTSTIHFGGSKEMVEGIQFAGKGTKEDPKEVDIENEKNKVGRYGTPHPDVTPGGSYGSISKADFDEWWENASSPSSFDKDTVLLCGATLYLRGETTVEIELPAAGGVDSEAAAKKVAEAVARAIPGSDLASLAIYNDDVQAELDEGKKRFKCESPCFLDHPVAIVSVQFEETNRVAKVWKENGKWYSVAVVSGDVKFVYAIQCVSR